MLPWVCSGWCVDEASGTRSLASWVGGDGGSTLHGVGGEAVPLHFLQVTYQPVQCFLLLLGCAGLPGHPAHAVPALPGGPAHKVPHQALPSLGLCSASPPPAAPPPQSPHCPSREGSRGLEASTSCCHWINLWRESLTCFTSLRPCRCWYH